MNNRLTLILGSALLYCTSTTWAGELTASAVLAETAKVGSESAIAKYYNTPKWQAILKGIGTANDEWLKVYASFERKLMESRAKTYLQPYGMLHCQGLRSRCLPLSIMTLVSSHLKPSALQAALIITSNVLQRR